MNEKEMLTSILSSQKELRSEINSMNENLVNMHTKNASEIVKLSKNISEIESESKLINTKLDTYHCKVITHDKIINGNPENLGKDGLVSTTTITKEAVKTLRTDMENEIKHLRGTFAIMWTGIITAGNVVWSLLTGKLNL